MFYIPSYVMFYIPSFKGLCGYIWIHGSERGSHNNAMNAYKLLGT